jgi:hypothetical protein
MAVIFWLLVVLGARRLGDTSKTGEIQYHVKCLGTQGTMGTGPRALDQSSGVSDVSSILKTK